MTQSPNATEIAEAIAELEAYDDTDAEFVRELVALLDLDDAHHQAGRDDRPS